ncbi:hypothetical protein NUW54_g10385 [Trametes sanguinea]|uniref:Uncharacterized protein n=1 Tax=Trametes sanguinea TaxID=158606 RepID=A0ACC1P0L6_9APHY|nr:hypothetical protein NUW54_g10385 [Trametes sanguinea]
MPVTRTFIPLFALHSVDSSDDAVATTGRKQPEYAGKLTKLRGELRSLIRNDLSTYRSRNPPGNRTTA